MDYKAENFETNFGKGVKIKKGIKSYEQFNCKNDLFARVYRTPSEKEGKLVDTDYCGVIFKASLVDNDQDYEQFKVLAERLQQVSGEEIPHSKSHFMGYISHGGLEQELSRIGAKVKVNLEDEQTLPEEMSYWLNSKSHLGGLVSDLAAYALGFPIIVSVVPNVGLLNALLIWGFGGPISEGILGMFSTDSKFGWCGPIHAFGFVPTRKFFKGKLRNPNYMLGKFMQNYQRLDAMGLNVGNQKEYAKQSKKADRYFRVLKDIFPFTEYRKGFSITYDSPNRDNVISFFDYVLEGGNVPQLFNSQTNVQRTKSQEKLVETNPIETDFINPWKIEIPKLGGKNNE